MQVINTRIKPLNRWDKDSIRPGPVGSVGDVNLQVKLKTSSPDMPQRYEKAFSGKNEVWSGSNISDGQWTGYTSGGRGAITTTQPMPMRAGFKTPVGWMMENILPVDRSREAKMVPLGQYSWESDKARIYRAKTTGDQFLPLPMGYNKPDLPRGSQYPKIVASAIGEGIALPAADIKITDPVFGETGSIVKPGTGEMVGIPGMGCLPEFKDKIWAPIMGDPRRKSNPPSTYPWRAVNSLGQPIGKYPDVGDNEIAAKLRRFGSPQIVFGKAFHPCGSIDRPSSEPYTGAPIKSTPEVRIPKTGDSRKRPIATSAPPMKRIKV